MGELIRRLWYLLRRGRRDAELAEELELHRAMAEQELAANGHSAHDAAVVAQLALGNDRSARERADDVWGWRWLSDLGQDLRFAGRLLVKAPGFAATVVTVLGVGLGVNHLFLTLVYSSTMRGLPIPGVDRVVYVSTFDDRQTDRTLSYPEFDDIRNGARAFSGIAAYTAAVAVVGDEGLAPDRVDTAYLSANAFDVVGVRPLLGRAIGETDDRPGAAPIALLGHDTWRARYSGDPGVLGRVVSINGTPTTIVGIVPPKSGFPSTAELWLPLAQTPGLAQQSRAGGTLRVIGRLRDGVTLSDGRAEIEAIVQQAAQEHAEMGANVRARVVPINERFFGAPTSGVWLAFIGAAFLVVGVCAANVANLMLARGVQRTREVAIRASLGASRGRVVRQLVCEAAVLAALGGAFGGVLAWAGVRLFAGAVPANLLPYWFHFGPDARVFAMLAGVSLLALLIFGVAPAVHAARADVNLVLKSVGRSALDARTSSRWSAGFLVTQLGLSVVLLALLVMGYRQDTPDLPSDTAIASTDILTASVTLPTNAFSTPALRAVYYQRLLDQLRTLPGVEAISIASALPRRGAVERTAALPGQASDAARRVWTAAIGPDYFAALGLSMVRGRGFVDADGDDSRRGGSSASATASADKSDPPANLPVIVNATFVEQLLGGGEAVGQTLTLATPTAPKTPPMTVTIVGVAPDVRQRSNVLADPLVYLPFAPAAPATAVVVLRSPGGHARADDVRAAALAVDASVATYRIMTMAAAIDESEWGGRSSSRLVTLVSLAAVLLAAVGLYAVTAYGVSERTQEIGLRMALGARARQVTAPILARAAKQAGLGLVVGVLGTVAWDLAFGFDDAAGAGVFEPWSLLIVAAIVAGVTVAACVVPVCRALRLDPLAALRHE